MPRLLNALQSGSARLIIWQVGTNDAIVGVDETLSRATVDRATETALLSGDGLHMNDRGYRCLAHAIAEAIEGAAGAKL